MNLLVSFCKRDQVYTVSLNEVPKSEVTASKVSRYRCWQGRGIFFGFNFFKIFFVERKSNVLFWFDLTEINMEVKAAGQRELCYERQT